MIIKIQVKIQIQNLFNNFIYISRIIIRRKKPKTKQNTTKQKTNKQKNKKKSNIKTQKQKQTNEQTKQTKMRTQFVFSCKMVKIQIRLSCAQN